MYEGCILEMVKCCYVVKNCDFNFIYVKIN